MTEQQTPDYYSIIGKMAHEIDDSKIILYPSKDKKGNALKQFSDLFDIALSSQQECFDAKLKEIRDWLNARRYFQKGEITCIDMEEFDELVRK